MLVISYGNDIIKSTYDALTASDISAYLKKDCKVALKPNLVVPGPASLGAVTHPEVTEGVIKYLSDYGIEDIKIIESSWVGEESTAAAFKHCGYEELSRRYNIPLVDLKKDGSIQKSYSGFDIKVCREALETDFLINIPVLKAHCQTKLTCCMKNLKGCIPDAEKRRFHTLGIHKPVAALNMIIKTGYCVVDGICGDLSFEEGGNPVTANRIIAGRDPLMVDTFCAALIGYSPDEIEYLTYGKEFGVGQFYNGDVEIIQLGTDNKQCGGNPREGKNASARRVQAAEKYRSYIDERSACSACFASLIYALHKIVSGVATTAELNRFIGNKLHIGQGFRNKTGRGTGIGNCAAGFDICIRGCPPPAVDIVKALKNMRQ